MENKHTCANCKKDINGRVFRFAVIGKVFEFCGIACREFFKRGL